MKTVLVLLAVLFTPGERPQPTPLVMPPGSTQQDCADLEGYLKQQVRETFPKSQLRTQCVEFPVPVFGTNVEVSP